MSLVSQSLVVTENMLTAHPDLDGIFASNESTSIGAAQALRSRPRKVKLVGFDWSPALLDDLKSGLIDSLVIQNPFQMGYQAVITAIAHRKGEQVTKIVDMEPRLLDLTNLNSAEMDAQLHPDLKKYLE